MSSMSIEKCVKGATKIKLAPPKSKYIEPILRITHNGEGGVGEVFRFLQFRLRDPSWTIAFKALIVAHLMIREGSPDATLRYLSTEHRHLLAVTTYTDVQTQGRNIRCYSNYLINRGKGFGKTKCDYVGGPEDRLKRLTVDKGLLRETEIVQEQIQVLLQCEFFDDEPENEISLMAFRLAVMDLLALYRVVNEGMINILQRYFEMSKPDAERALAIYKKYSRQTEFVVAFLSMAKHFEHSTRLQIPKIKHAPTGLTQSLEDYLHDKDFEINRRQYLAQQEAKKSGKPIKSTLAAGDSKSSSSKPAFPEVPPNSTPAAQPPKGPPPDLIDFFESIDQPQQNNVQAQNSFEQPSYTSQFPNNQPANSFTPQQNSFISPQATNPFGQFQQQPIVFSSQPQTQQQPPPQSQFQSPIQTQSTGAGFGGYTPQPQQSQMLPQQTSFSDPIFNNNYQQQPQSQFGFPQQPQQQQQPLARQQTNPFRTTMMQQPTGSFQPSLTGSQVQSPSSTGSNPFAAQAPSAQQNGPAFSGAGSNQAQSSSPFQSQPLAQQSQPIAPQRTGTNPFAKVSPSNTSSQTGVVTHATGSTNPFKQSSFVNQQTGQGWQAGQQGTMGGLEHLPTLPVFPRPGQPQVPQQQPQQGGWY